MDALPSCKLLLATANQNHHVLPRNVVEKQVVCPVFHIVYVVVMKIVVMKTQSPQKMELMLTVMRKMLWKMNNIKEKLT